jgi:nitrogen fixation/metabolism regulation signal transduction histidine kinase
VAEDRNGRSNKLESGYVTVDHNWLITSFNEKAARILGTDRKNMIGKDYRELSTTTAGSEKSAHILNR